MTAPDLTPAEARAEIEAFMGDAFDVTAWRGHLQYHVAAHKMHVYVTASGASYRAAVSALKQAWRDAVRPWLRLTVGCYETHREEHSPEEVVSRVLGEEA